MTLLNGWMASTPKQVVHYFDGDGQSLCHLWSMTVLDKPVLDRPKCPACLGMLRSRKVSS